MTGARVVEGAGTAKTIHKLSRELGHHARGVREWAIAVHPVCQPVVYAVCIPVGLVQLQCTRGAGLIYGQRVLARTRAFDVEYERGSLGRRNDIFR